MRPKLTLEVPTAPDHLVPETDPKDDPAAFTQAFTQTYLETLNQRAALQFPQLEIEVRKIPGYVTSVRQNGRGEVEWETLDAVLDWLEDDRDRNLAAAAQTRCDRVAHPAAGG